MAKRRKYSECYLNLGFTTLLAIDGIEKAQCVLCHAVLGAESLKTSKLSNLGAESDKPTNTIVHMQARCYQIMVNTRR